MGTPPATNCSRSQTLPPATSWVCAMCETSGRSRGYKLGLRSVRYARHRESGTISQIQTGEARSLRCRVETVFIGGFIQWVLQRGGLFQCVILLCVRIPLPGNEPRLGCAASSQAERLAYSTSLKMCGLMYGLRASVVMISTRRCRRSSKSSDK